MKKIGYILSGLCLLCACKSNVQKDDQKDIRRPNIIFIMSDDHDQKAISAYGDKIGEVAPTPNIDRIAANGAVFRNNFVTNSLCGPSRATILTGKFSHENGFRGNWDEFDGSQQTLPKILGKAGYKTAIVGKWHLGATPHGFDYWEILDNQGNYYNPDFIKGSDTTVVPGYATDLITKKSIAWLKKQKDSNKPFFLMVHHKAPHRNQMPPKRYYNLYDSVTFPLPDTYFAEFDDTRKPAKEQMMNIYEDMYRGYDLKMTEEEGSPELDWNPFGSEFKRMSDEQRAAWDQAYQEKNDAMHRAHLSGKELAKWKYQRFMEDYCATVRAVDDGVGAILDYLKESGLEENTIVMYTSDQGFFIGENGWFDKRFMYEKSFRTPLLIQYPGHIKAHSEINALTQNLDYGETILDYAGAKIPEDMQGKSMRPLLENSVKNEDFRDALYYHYYDYPSFHMVKKHAGVRTIRYKLIYFYDDVDTWELYDLKEDPNEQNNLYDNPAYAAVQQAMHSKLDSLQQLYQVTDKEFEKSSPAQVKAIRAFFEGMKNNAGNRHGFIIQDFIKAKKAK
jgi:arylsulfatase A-like enzyme